MKKRLLSLVLVLCAVMAILPVSVCAKSLGSAAAADDAGKWLISKKTTITDHGEDTIEYQYDESGRLLKETTKHGEYIQSQNYYYDDTHHTLSIKYSSSYGEMEGFYEEWECDDDMRPIKGTSHFPGELGQHTRKYDSQGRLIEEQSRGLIPQDGTWSEYYTTQYSYDSAGNLIKVDEYVDTSSGRIQLGKAEYHIESVDQNGNAVRVMFDDTINYDGAMHGFILFEYIYIAPKDDPPQIVSNPQDYIGASGDTASFTVTATGEDLHYRWQYSDDDGVSWNNGTAYDHPSASCIINNVTDGRLYRCLVYNSAGTVESHAAQVLLKKETNWSRNRDQWSFVNADTVFSPHQKGYYITSRDYDHLIQNLSPYDAIMVDHKAASSSNGTPATLRFNVDWQRSMFKNWGGSCAGMSVSSMLFFNGELDLFEDLGQAKGSSVSNVQIGDPVRSLINFYHNQQYLTVWQNTIRDFMNLSVGEQLSTIERSVLSGNPVLIFYEWIDYVNNGRVGSHAVVVYDVETGSFPKTVDGITITYQKKFHIYDPSSPNNPNQNYDIYYTAAGQKGVWCLPGHNIISCQSIPADQSVDIDITPGADANKVNLPRYNNGAFELATADKALLNAVNYRDGTVSSAVLNAKLGSARLYALSDDQYSVTTSGGAIAVDGIRYTKTGENGITAYIAAAPNYLADGSTTVSDVTVFLPEKSSYTVKSDDALSFGFADKGIATFADTDSAGAITFRQTGGASIAANKSCDISVTMLADSQNKKWDSVTVTAENGKKLDVVPTDSGLMLTGDSLKGAVVEITNGSKTSSATIDSGIKAAEIIYQGGKITVEQTTMVFSDVSSGAYYYQPVYWAVNHVPQITNGTGDATFSPEWECLRCQIVTFLWRAMGCPEPQSTKNPFVDVKTSDYFYKAVLWAVEQGITNGMDATHFGPNLTCTRGQAVTFLWRAEGKPTPRTTRSEFTDVQNRDDYFYTPVLWAVENGITNGTGDGKFSPNMICLREQIVTFLYRDLA